MTKRYGRNQRRLHREEIGRLQTALAAERFGGFYRADGTGISFAGIVSFKETRQETAFGMIERDVDINGFMTDEALRRWQEESVRVEWSGLGWRAGSISILGYEDGIVHVRVSMTATDGGRPAVSRI